MTDTITLPTIEESAVASDVDGWWQELNELDVVIVGSVTGTTLAQLVVAVLDRGRNRRTATRLQAGRRR